MQRIVLFILTTALLISFPLTNFAHTTYFPPDTVVNGLAAKSYMWLYNIPWEWKVEVPISTLNYYQQKARPKWTGEYSYYSKYIDPADRGILAVTKGLKETLVEAKATYSWNTDQEIMFVVSMIQQFRFIPDSTLGYQDYEKYPVETLFDGFGDCEDKAILAAALLKRMGYDVCLLFLETADKKRSHIALGAVIPNRTTGNYFMSGTKRYYYIETTYAGWRIGETPAEWQGLAAVVIPVD